ncbi:MAG: hypothetical protein GY774_21195 [Planctomycetes bacterium]|nr:hypothetical protein [Planctomycetota bacterium]
MSTQEKKVTLVSCILGMAIGIAVVGLIPTLLSENTALAQEQPSSTPGSHEIVSCGPVTRFFERGVDTWNCNMVVNQDGYIWFVAVNNNLEDTFSVDQVVDVLWEFQLEKSN